MNNWFRKDMKVKIVSIVLAVIFWLYVSNVSNPFMSKTFYNIPVTIENEDYLEQNGYTIKNTFRNYIDVTIRGRKDAVENVRSTDFATTLDFAQISGVSDKKIQLTEPICIKKDVIIESYNPTSIDIQLARNKTGTFAVDLESNISMKPGYVLLKTTVSPETMPIFGEEAIIDSVESIKASLELKDLDRDVTKQVQCKVYNKAGKEINSLSNDLKVTVKAEVAKEVSVSLVTRGRLATDYVETLRVIDPVKVLVTGPVEVLAGLTDLKTEQVDITGINNNFTATIPLVVPEGVKLVNPSKDITVNISIEKLVIGNVALTANDVSILNAKNDGTLVYEIASKEMVMQFKGRQADVDAVKIDALKPAVDVSGLLEGTHRLPLNISTPAQAKLVQRVYVEVRIAKTPETNETPEP